MRAVDRKQEIYLKGLNLEGSTLMIHYLISDSMMTPNDQLLVALSQFWLRSFTKLGSHTGII